jgi:hypothetical protein
MSTLRRVIIHNAEHVDHDDREHALVVSPLPAFDAGAAVWRRVQGILQKRIATMEANVDKATDAWGAEQGLSRAEWEAKMRSYAFALEELHKLAEDIAASQSEIP